MKPSVIRVSMCGLCHRLVPAWKSVCWRCQVKLEEGWADR